MLFKLKQVKVTLEYVDGMVDALSSISHSIEKPMAGWGDIHKVYIWIYSEQDALAFKLKFIDSVDHASFKELGPSDDEEVKIHCHRCNGYVFSVSGYEYKDQAHLRSYRCQMLYSHDEKKDVCYYEHPDTNLAYSKSAFGNY